jgi:hypothetical protein
MAEMKLGEIRLEKDESLCRAFWHPLDGPPVLLCTIHLDVYARHAFIREAFVNLAGEIAANLDRPAGSGVTLQRASAAQPVEAKIDRRQFGCWNCTRPEAVDARYMLGVLSEGDIAARLSPLGTPLFCCKVRPVAVW